METYAAFWVKSINQEGNPNIISLSSFNGDKTITAQYEKDSGLLCDCSNKKMIPVIGKVSATDIANTKLSNILVNGLPTSIETTPIPEPDILASISKFMTKDIYLSRTTIS